MERKYFVIRITNANEAFDDIRNEFLAGRLRQGWGPKGADLRGEPVSFITALKERWAESMENTPRRYSILLPMTKIQRGDIIIVPKLSINQYGMGNYFTVAECTAEYTFEPLEAYNDYGHILGIKTLGTWDYRSANDSANLIGKLLTGMSFSKAVNTIKNPETIQAIENLIASSSQDEVPARQHEKIFGKINQIFSLENSLAEVFRKIPGVKTVSQIGSDLIVTYTLERIKGVDLVEQTWFVQINNADVGRLGASIEKHNAALGILITTGERTQSLAAAIEKLAFDMSKKNISVYLVAGVEVMRLILRYDLESLI